MSERTCVKCGRFGHDREGTECPGCGCSEFWSGRVNMVPFTPTPTGHRINYEAKWFEASAGPSPAIMGDDEVSMTAEARAREMLDRLGMPDALTMTAGDVVELANLIAEVDRLRKQGAGAPRAEAVKFIANALGGEPSPFADKSEPSGGHKKAGRSHFGRVELRDLLDLIYGGPPAEDAERIR